MRRGHQWRDDRDAVAHAGKGVAVGACFDAGALRCSDLRLKIIARFVVHGQHGKGAAAIGIALVLRQLKRVAGGEPANRTCAFEHFVVQFQRLQHQLAVGIGRAAVAGDALSAAIVNGKRGQFARFQARLLFSRRGEQQRWIPAADTDSIDLHLAPRAQFVDRVVRFGGAHAMKANDVAIRCGGRLGFAVEDYDAVFGLAVATLLVVAGLVVFEAPAEAF